MDLNTVAEIVHPRERRELPNWRTGDAFLAGGTWLFSEPQPHLQRLIDLASLEWPAAIVDEQGLEIAATCTVGQLDGLDYPSEWLSAPLIHQCCAAFLASFKVCRTATVGGNLCLSLPAGPMISLMAGLDGDCVVWRANGATERIRALDFVTGAQSNVLASGDILRKVEVSAAALSRRSAFRQISLHPYGRSAALLIGSRDDNGAIQLTITASTIRPVRLSFASVPDAQEFRLAVLAVPSEQRCHDIHGDPFWRWSMTVRLAEEIRRELLDSKPS